MSHFSPSLGDRIIRLCDGGFVYCTVGGRSYLYARKLVAGSVDAVNYRDGILG